MKLTAKDGFIVLEAYEPPKEEGKILLPNAPKFTQIYRVVGPDVYKDLKAGELVYIKGFPTQITSKDRTLYMIEEKDVIAKVDLNS